MKTKILFIVVAMVCSSLCFSSALKEKKVYSYGWAYSYKHKVIYVSCIVSAVENSVTLQTPLYNVLVLQWHKKVSPLIEDRSEYVADYSQDVFTWNTYNFMEDNRAEMIRKYKREGFSIHYVDDFYYQQNDKE